MILDQRAMVGRRHHETVGDVEAAWAAYARKAAQEKPVGWDGRHRLLDTGDTVPAYVSDNRWVADCPACQGGIACWSQNPRGACLDCGRIYQIAFPEDRQEIEAVLVQRPTQNRHWFVGDPVDMLIAENIEHGLTEPVGRLEGS